MPANLNFKMALLMFDYDGVIVDSLEQFFEDFMAACAQAGFYELRNQQEALSLFDENVYKSLKLRGVDEAKINEILKNYETRVMKASSKQKLFCGMKEVLIKLCQEHKVVVVTSNLSSVPQQLFEEKGITGIEDVIGAEKEKSKVKKIERTMGKHPHLTAFYVGDTKGDILEGKAAGAKTIGVAWGWHGADKLQEASPDYLVYTPAELFEVLDLQKAKTLI